MQRVTQMHRFARIGLVTFARRAALLTMALSVMFATSGAALAATERGAKVYLMRGFMNVFSLGLDELSAKIERRGIRSEVYNHLSWSRLVGEITSEYKSGQTRPIIIIGHSAGGGAVISMVEALGRAGVPVALAITLDIPSHTVAAGRVGNFLNLYVDTGVHTAGREFRGKITNVNLSKQMSVGHITIDKTDAVHNIILRHISQAVSGARRSTARAGVAGGSPQSPER